MGFAIVEVWIVEIAEFGANLHFVEGVADVGIAEFVQLDGFGIVGFNGDEGDVAGFVVVGEFLDSGFVELRSGAVIAGEDQHEDLAGGVVLEAVLLVVDPGKAEIRRGRANRQGWGSRAVGAGGDGASTEHEGQGYAASQLRDRNRDKARFGRNALPAWAFIGPPQAVRNMRVNRFAGLSQGSRSAWDKRTSPGALGVWCGRFMALPDAHISILQS